MGEDLSNLEYSKVCFLSNFPPKECGIATYTSDLVFAMDKQFNPRLKSRVIALNGEEEFYNYNKRVIMQINKEDIGDYIKKAKEINRTPKIKLVCIQHEFGIFGGEDGSYLVPFLETIKKPVVVVFHSVVSNPLPLKKRIVKFIGEKAAAIIVMAESAKNILETDYGIDKKKIYFIPHGVPDAPIGLTKSIKKKLKLENKIVLLTFGLLSSGKGIEYMIKALPQLVKKYPNLLYLIIGETHPVIRKLEGENYRQSLIEQINELGLKNNVKFLNRYVTLKEIVEYLLASDIYICTNLDENQIVSGTLSYALGCGKAIISTPSIYAKEVLAGEKGLLVKLRDSESYAKAVEQILSDPKLKEKIEWNAYNSGRTMTWPNVASRYLHIFNKIVRLREETTDKFPVIKLNHLKKLTDNFGCLQFSKLSTPDKNSGYTIDDNSRALMAAVMHNLIFKSRKSLDLAEVYLNFLEQASENNFSSNFKNKNEIFDSCSEDSIGRVLWALGYVIYYSDFFEKRAKKLMKKIYKKAATLQSLRARAFAIEGLYYFNKKYNGRKNISNIKKIADSIIDSYNGESSEDWCWFEDKLTYSNSKIPEALFLAYDATKNEKYLEIAEKTLKFLWDLTYFNGQFSPIGQNGWCKRNGNRAFFDQQPLDTSCMVQTCLMAYKITENKDYYKKAILAFNWYLGKNHLKQRVYDEITGGCFDGLSKNAINLNRGAESTISYLVARLMLEEAKQEMK